MVLRGARERLTVELRGGKAPLAVMESLSDAESVYSLDSRRSSAALRGSPMLGCLPFPLDAPIPEENPSLSSRTELLGADCLGPATPEHLGESGPYFASLDSMASPEYGMRLSPGTARYSGNHCLSQRGQGATPPSPPPPLAGGLDAGLQDDGCVVMPDVYSPRNTPPHRLSPQAGCRSADSLDGDDWATENGQSGVEAELAAASSSLPNTQLSNGNPSQAVLEFAQYLDSLFRLDGSSSPPLELSDGESESGRGSYLEQEEGLGEGQSMDDKRLLARAIVEPNLVPKPPRTFAGSADPSSGISLSPSFPLSSSGELNDLSPAEGAANSLRTSPPGNYPEENTVSSMV